MGLIAALLADAVGIVVFATLGRRSHDEADGAVAVLTTAAPFLVALAIGWLLVVGVGRWWSRPLDQRSIEAGIIIWVATVAIGLLLRRTLWDRGTAAAFVVVAGGFLGAVMVGWRAARGRLRPGRARPAPDI